jgi:hypothetical protein
MLRSRSGRATRAGTSLLLLIFLVLVRADFAADKATPSPSASARGKRDFDLTNLPLPIGHEAKGLVLPDFNVQGRQIGRVEAASARRTDESHVLFKDIKILTYDEQNQPDLQIEMSEGVLDLKTRVITSPRRTTVSRADFNIIGDTFEFDPASRTGSLHGAVKMVITGKDHFAPANEEPNEGGPK